MAFLVAFAIHRFVEKPCARLRKRFAGGARAAREPAAIAQSDEAAAQVVG
jgi:peptidoglycan/LPS O-acetylase OafA/YrhL